MTWAHAERANYERILREEMFGWKRQQMSGTPGTVNSDGSIQTFHADIACWRGSVWIPAENLPRAEHHGWKAIAKSKNGLVKVQKS